MTLRKQEKYKEINQKPIIYQAEEIFPSIISVECSGEEITAFLEDSRKVSIPTA